MKKQEIKKIILKYCLQNAVFYKGKADSRAVLGKIMAEQPELRRMVGKIKKEVRTVICKINSLSLQKQKEKLAKIAPELLKKEAKKQEQLPSLGKVKKFVTRFAGAPTGPLHLSHLLRAVYLSYLYAKKYKGKFLLRFEDTDPRKVKKEYYEFIKQDLKNCGIKWDKLIIESNHLDIYYTYTGQLIKKNSAYVCTCPAANFRELKLKKKECPCRANSIKENLNKWNFMLSGKYKEGDVVVRLKISMNEPNPVLRDPPLLRVIESKHALQGNKYRVWPLYNYACAIEDHEAGVTHVFRGKEHEHNTAVQSRIYKAFNWTIPTIINFGMIYLPGKKLHTRDIKQMIEKKEVTGWDDPKLPTVKALLRRGFQPQTFKKIAIQCGLTKTDITLGMENLEAINRKLIDPLANRYMVVIDPVRIKIKNVPTIRDVKENLHPNFPERGLKKIPVNPNKIYISKNDWKQFKGKRIRLIGFGNIRLDKISQYVDNQIRKDIQKIQWVSEPYVKVKILTPSGKLNGIGEPTMKKLETNDLIQMERIGFGRVDSKKKDLIIICFAHK